MKYRPRAPSSSVFLCCSCTQRSKRKRMPSSMRSSATTDHLQPRTTCPTWKRFGKKYCAGILLRHLVSIRLRVSKKPRDLTWFQISRILARKMTSGMGIISLKEPWSLRISGPPGVFCGRISLILPLVLCYTTRKSGTIQKSSSRNDSSSMVSQGRTLPSPWSSVSGGGKFGTTPLFMAPLKLSLDCALGRPWRIGTGSIALLRFCGRPISTQYRERSALRPPLLGSSIHWLREYRSAS
jgi:hypothetical protein